MPGRAIRLLPSRNKGDLISQLEQKILVSNHKDQLLKHPKDYSQGAFFLPITSIFQRVYLYMEFKIASERVWKLEVQVNAANAESKASIRKLDAFGALSKLTGFFQKPNPEDFELQYKELRYQPFWHIATKAHYVYDRDIHYQIENVKSEVKTTTIEGKEYQITNGHLHIPATEHCQNDLQQEKLIDALTGVDLPNLKRYIEKGGVEVKNDRVSDGFSTTEILVPPQYRVSGIMREMLASMIKGIQADKIFEEEIELTCIDLYYRPVYAFKFYWKSKKQEGIIELDAITGDINSGTRIFSEYLGKAIDRNFLFDLGADAAGMFIPGGSIAVKMAKKVMDMNEK